MYLFAGTLRHSGLPDDLERESRLCPPGLSADTMAIPVDSNHPDKAGELLSSKNVTVSHQVDLLQLGKEFWSLEYLLSIKLSFDYMVKLTCLLLTKLFLTHCFSWISFS